MASSGGGVHKGHKSELSTNTHCMSFSLWILVVMYNLSTRVHDRASEHGWEMIETDSMSQRTQETVELKIPHVIHLRGIHFVLKV